MKSILKAGRAEQAVGIDGELPYPSIYRTPDLPYPLHLPYPSPDKLYGHVIASDNEGKALRPVKK